MELHLAVVRILVCISVAEFSLLRERRLHLLQLSTAWNLSSVHVSVHLSGLHVVPVCKFQLLAMKMTLVLADLGENLLILTGLVDLR